MALCTTQCKNLLFHAKTIVRDSCNSELARLKKKKKKGDFGHLVTFWFGTVPVFLMPQGVLLVTKTLEDEWYTVIKAVRYYCPIIQS